MQAVGAGDPGIMVGYAADETPERMPPPVMLAHGIWIPGGEVKHVLDSRIAHWNRRHQGRKTKRRKERQLRQAVSQQRGKDKTEQLKHFGKLWRRFFMAPIRRVVVQHPYSCPSRVRDKPQGEHPRRALLRRAGL